jgi:hypothetical protein
MNLLRPSGIEDAQIMVKNYAASKPEILQGDFYRSLLAVLAWKKLMHSQ